MKWREVKLLCAGMCVCTVIAAGKAVIQTVKEADRTAEHLAVEETQEAEEMQEARDTWEEAQEVKDTQQVQDAQQAQEADAAHYEVHMVGAGNETEEIEKNLIIADVTNYVNIRSIPGEDGEIIGKLYNDSVGRKLDEENGWYYIESGSVKGYVKGEFVLTGEAAEIRAKEVGTRLAEVTTTTLKVREEATTESAVLGLVPGGDILNVLEEVDGWVKVDVEEGTGYVSTDYVNVYTENVEAESKEEEAARLKKEAEERRRAEEAVKEALKQQNANKPENKTDSGSQNNVSNTVSGSKKENPPDANESDAGKNDTELGKEIADYALQFVGNPYVYGGTSLTSGADCSGFVQSVYKHFGISLPRTSGEQGASGRAVEGIEHAKPGDLVWYSGHIGIYIGDGKIVHASNPKNGIIISEATYRKILGVRRII